VLPMREVGPGHWVAQEMPQPAVPAGEVQDLQPA